MIEFDVIQIFVKITYQYYNYKKRMRLLGPVRYRYG